MINMTEITEQNEAVSLLNKYKGETTKILAVKVGMICESCFHEWGFSLNLNEPLIYQIQKMQCVKCLQNKITERNGANEQNEYNQTQYQK